MQKVKSAKSLPLRELNPGLARIGFKDMSESIETRLLNDRGVS